MSTTRETAAVPAYLLATPEHRGPSRRKLSAEGKGLTVRRLGATSFLSGNVGDGGEEDAPTFVGLTTATSLVVGHAPRSDSATVSSIEASSRGWSRGPAAGRPVDRSGSPRRARRAPAAAATPRTWRAVRRPRRSHARQPGHSLGGSRQT